MPQGTVPFPYGNCKICQDRATGIHYGVVSCEGCKGFFKRSTFISARYRCFFGGSCKPTPQTRNRCKSCRFNLCKGLGMALDAVKMGRIPKVDKERALEQQRKQQASEASSKASYVAATSQGSSTTQELQNSDMSFGGTSVMSKSGHVLNQSKIQPFMSSSVIGSFQPSRLQTTNSGFLNPTRNSRPYTIPSQTALPPENPVPSLPYVTTNLSMANRPQDRLGSAASSTTIPHRPNDSSGNAIPLPAGSHGHNSSSQSNISYPRMHRDSIATIVPPEKVGAEDLAIHKGATAYSSSPASPNNIRFGQVNLTVAGIEAPSSDPAPLKKRYILSSETRCAVDPTNNSQNRMRAPLPRGSQHHDFNLQGNPELPLAMTPDLPKTPRLHELSIPSEVSGSLQIKHTPILGRTSSSSDTDIQSFINTFHANPSFLEQFLVKPPHSMPVPEASCRTSVAFANRKLVLGDSISASISTHREERGHDPKAITHDPGNQTVPESSNSQNRTVESAARPIVTSITQDVILETMEKVDKLCLTSPDEVRLMQEELTGKRPPHYLNTLKIATKAEGVALWTLLFDSIPINNSYIIGFCQAIPGIVSLSGHDQEVLMKSAYFGIWLVRCAALYADGDFYLRLNSGARYSFWWMMHFLPPDLVNDFVSLSEQLQHADISENMRKLICALILTDPTDQMLENKSQVIMLNNHYLDTLSHSVSTQQSGRDSEILRPTSKILKIIRRIGLVSEKLKDSVGKYNIEELPDYCKGRFKDDDEDSTEKVN